MRKASINGGFPPINSINVGFAQENHLATPESAFKCYVVCVFVHPWTCIFVRRVFPGFRLHPAPRQRTTWPKDSEKSNPWCSRCGFMGSTGNWPSLAWCVQQRTTLQRHMFIEDSPIVFWMIVSNLIKTRINHPFGNGLCNLFVLIRGWFVLNCFNHTVCSSSTSGSAGPQPPQDIGCWLCRERSGKEG